jgi:hypothetical protein
VSFIRSSIGVLISLVLVCSLNAEPTRCGGGGPHSFNDISVSVENHLDWIDAAGSVKEFTPLEKRNSLIFRNQENKVGGIFLGNPRPYLFGHSDFPISRVVDSAEQAILTIGPGDLFNPWSPTPRWIQYTNEQVIPLFWHRDKLFAMSARTPTKDNPEYNFFTHRPYQSTNAKFCSFKVDPALNFRLASGSEYPFVFFYSTHPTRTGNFLALVKFNVNECKVASTSTFNDPFPGEITGVYRFEPLDSIAVKVNNEKENLMWRTPNGCQYFDIGNLPPIVLNPSQPVIATWSKQTGFTLFNLSTSQKVRILDTLPITAMGTEQAWMNHQGTQLYVAPVFDRKPFREGSKLKFGPQTKTPNRWLFKVDVNFPQQP